MALDLLTTDWRAQCKSLRFSTDPFIDGAAAPSRSDARFQTISPATGQTLCSLPEGCEADVDAAAAAARAAFEDGRWRGLPLQRRRAVLLRLADLIELHADDLALLEVLEVGKAIANARDEMAMSTSFMRFYAEAIDKMYGDVAPSDGSLVGFSVLRPRGVVGAIVPWNFPLANSVMKVAPALAAGNTMVLKPSEVATQSALRLAELAIEAGLPPGVLNVVPGLGATVGAAIARHPDVDFLSFTGSTQTGRMLMGYAGESNGKPLMLECGGKSAQVVSADLVDDLEAMADRIVQDAFWNQGQWCSARSRLIVEASLHDRLLQAVADRAAKLTPGDPLDPRTRFGTISSRTQYERVRQYLAIGRDEGAAAVVEGSQGSPCALSMGPSIFANVTARMRIAREEIFGPVLSVIRADNFDDALAKANDTAYGLSATVWTRDARRARVAAQTLRGGRIIVRTDPAATGSASIAIAAEPAGASGFGVEKGLEGLRSYCRVQAVEVL